MKFSSPYKMQNYNSELKIIKYPNPILRKKSEGIKEITPEIRKLAEEMVLAMGKDKGMGLAAPQVGILKRIIVFETGQGATALINPKIVKRGKEKFLDVEGCLSFPDVWLKIKRSKKVEVEATDLRGEKVRFSAEFMVARILQHEIDHLEGVLFTDRIGFFEKRKVRKQLKGLEKKYGLDR